MYQKEVKRKTVIFPNKINLTLDKIQNKIKFVAWQIMGKFVYRIQKVLATQLNKIYLTLSPMNELSNVYSELIICVYNF